jgi:two-component system, OmpR family, response regulator CpxR
VRKILIIADDDRLSRELSEQFAPAGFLVEIARDGATGLEMACAGRPALVVLALLVSGFQAGFDLMCQLRAQLHTSIVMLTRRTEDVDRILGLEMGADDCVSEPFNPRVLLARIHAILRRPRDGHRKLPGQPPDPGLVVGDVSLDPGRRLVRRADSVIDLTAAEFALLEALLRKAGTVIRREELAALVLGRALSRGDRSLDTHVSRLRRKLGRGHPDAERIKTIRNVGYLYLCPSGSESSGSK